MKAEEGLIVTWAPLERVRESWETGKPDERAGGAEESIELKIWVNSKGWTWPMEQMKAKTSRARSWIFQCHDVDAEQGRQALKQE